MRKKVAIVTGGYSGEDQIAFKSAKVVHHHLANAPFDTEIVHITKSEWALVRGEQRYPINKHNFSAIAENEVIEFDAVYVVIHGTPGEDGKLQGYFEMIGMPYAGSDLLPLAITFNKSVCKDVLRPLGIASAQSVIIDSLDNYDPSSVTELSMPLFVKPNKGGSSIGVSKVKSIDELLPALEKVMREDDEAIVEEFISGTEVTCGVLNWKGETRVLTATEVVSKNEFFDFDAKYQSDQTEEITPARLKPEVLEEVRRQTGLIFDHLELKGMARVDFIIRDDVPYMIEVNTIPGLSEQSIIPQQARYFGIELSDLFEEMIRPVLC